MTGVTDRQRGPYGVTPVLDDAKYTHWPAAIVTSVRRPTDEGLKSAERRAQSAERKLQSAERRKPLNFPSAVSNLPASFLCATIVSSPLAGERQ